MVDGGWCMLDTASCMVEGEWGMFLLKCPSISLW